jgi:SAM-dependent methyltransferase
MIVAPARLAAVHERVLTPYELALLQRHRQQLLARATGTVVDLGGGTGAHFDWYPSSVDRVVVVGVDPFVRSIVARRAERARVPVQLATTAAAAGVGPGGADTIVGQLVLCAVPALDGILGWVAATLAPDGQLLLLEHVPPRGEAGMVRRIVRPIWRNLSSGCDMSYDVTAAVRRAGLLPTDIERFPVPTLTPPLRTCATVVARHARWTRGAGT